MIYYTNTNHSLQSPTFALLGAHQRDIEPWNFYWCRAMGLLFNLCIFCLCFQYIWHCKYLSQPVVACSVILNFYLLVDLNFADNVCFEINYAILFKHCRLCFCCHILVYSHCIHGSEFHFVGHFWSLPVW